MSADLPRPPKVVAEWLKDGEMLSLTKGDHKSKLITLSVAFNAEAAIFELAVPVKVKGVNPSIEAIICIDASTIASLELPENPTDIPSWIKGEFPSTVLGLHFTLNDPPAIIVPIGTPEPLSRVRKSAGDVLDKIRDLSKATVLSIYIEACNAPNELQEIRDKVRKRLFTPYNIQHHIASMYSGDGGKHIDLSVTASPPPYDKVVMSPPPPPPIDRSRKKRARQDSDPKRDDNTPLWDRLRALEQISGRVKTLEAEIEELRQKNTNLEEKYKKAEQGNTQLQEKCDALKSRLEDNESTNEALKKRLEDNESTNEALKKRLEDNESTNEALKKRLEDNESTNEELEDRLEQVKSTNEELEGRLGAVLSSKDAFEDRFDLQLAELREDMDVLGNNVRCVQYGQITNESLEEIQKVVIEDISRRLADR